MQNNWLPNFASNKTCILYLNKIHRVFSVQQMLLLVNMMIWWLLLLPWVTRLQVDHHHRLLMQVSDKTFIVSANTNEDIHNKDYQMKKPTFSRITTNTTTTSMKAAAAFVMPPPFKSNHGTLTSNDTQHQPTSAPTTTSAASLLLPPPATLSYYNHCSSRDDFPSTQLSKWLSFWLVHPFTTF